MISTTTEASWEGSALVDLQGPASAGILSSSLSPPGGQVRAVQDVAGFGAVAVAGNSTDGQPGNFLRASATWSEILTNVDALPHWYEIHLSIPEIQLAFSGNEFHDLVEEQSRLRYNINLRVNDVTLFVSVVGLRSGDTEHVLEELGVDLGGVKAPSELRYTFAPSAFVLDGGTLGPAETLDATFSITTDLEIPGLGILADASIGSPFGPERAEITIVDLPEPGASASIATSLTALALAVRRRRHARA